MVEVFNAEIQFNKNRIYKRLHIEPSNEAVFVYSENAFEGIIRKMLETLDMTTGYRILEGDNRLSVGRPEIDSAPYQVVAAVTCSNEIMDAIYAYMDRCDFLEGYLLNDITNDVLFAASNQMNKKIGEEMKKLGCNLSTGCFPGDDCDLEHQSQILARFQSENFIPHVQLTDTNMLDPEKSMLYIFGAAPDYPEQKIGHDCSTCPNTSCFFRSEDAVNYLCKE